jgi:hypothetical protein
VGVIDIVGEKAAEHPNGLSLLHFAIIFCIAWKIWADLTMWINYFEIDDIFQRICVVFYLVCLFGFTTNISYAFDGTYTSCIAFYITQRLFGASWFILAAVVLKQVRGAMLLTALVTIVTAAIWIASIHVPWPNQLAPIVIAIIIDLFGNVILIWMVGPLSFHHTAKTVLIYIQMKASAKARLPARVSVHSKALQILGFVAHIRAETKDATLCLPCCTFRFEANLFEIVCFLVRLLPSHQYRTSSGTE